MCTFSITQLVTHASEVPVPGSYHVVMCDMYLPSVPSVQCSLVQVTKCWDQYRSHKTLQFNSSPWYFLPCSWRISLGAKRAVCVMFHIHWDQCLREPEGCVWVVSALLGALLPRLHSSTIGCSLAC